MKKTRMIRWMALLLAGALLLGFAACHKGDPDDGPTTEPLVTTTDPYEFTTEPPTSAVAAPGYWSIEIRGVPNITSFNSQDAQYLPKVQVEMISTNLETGLSSKVTYGGVTLRSLLTTFCGVSYVSSVTVSSISGASVVYNPVVAMAEDTILAWEVDGAPIDAEPPLRMCPKSGSAELLVRQVSSINVVVGMEPTTVSVPAYVAPPMGNTNDYNYTTTTRRTTTTTWPTYQTDPTNPDSTPVTTTEPTTTTTTTTTTTRTYTSYVYSQPTTNSTRPTTTTRPTLTPPEWWPPDVPYYG